MEETDRNSDIRVMGRMKRKTLGEEKLQRSATLTGIEGQQLIHWGYNGGRRLVANETGEKRQSEY